MPRDPRHPLNDPAESAEQHAKRLAIRQLLVEGEGHVVEFAHRLGLPVPPREVIGVAVFILSRNAASGQPLEAGWAQVEELLKRPDDFEFYEVPGGGGRVVVNVAELKQAARQRGERALRAVLARQLFDNAQIELACGHQRAAANIKRHARTYRGTATPTRRPKRRHGSSRARSLSSRRHSGLSPPAKPRPRSSDDDPRPEPDLVAGASGCPRRATG